MNDKIYVGLADSATLPEGYDRYVFTGEGCVESIEVCKKKGLPFLVIDNPWKDEEIIERAVSYLKDIRDNMVCCLSDELNVYTGFTYENKSWDMILSAWLQGFLSSYYYKYIVIKKINEIEGEVATRFYENVDFEIPIDFLEWEDRCCYSDYYNWMQYLRLLNHMRQDIDQVISDKDNINCKRPQRKKIHQVIVRQLKMFHYFFSWTLANEPNLIVATDLPWSRRYVLDTTIKSGGRVVFFDGMYELVREKLLDIPIDMEWRNNAAVPEKSADEFIRFVYNRVKKELPVVYLEGHRFIRRFIEKRYHKIMRANAFMYGASGAIGDEIYKIIAANIKENGGTLYGVQHGGNYNVEKIWKYDDEYKMADVFYTWGWSRKDGNMCHFKPMPSVKLQRIKKIKRESCRGDYILYVSYSYPRHIARFDRTWIFYPERKRNEKEFMGDLSHEITDQFKIRLYSEDYNWRIKEGLDSLSDAFKYDTERNFLRSLYGAKLVILSDWNTTVNEVMAAGIPFIFIREDGFLEEDAVADVKLMRDVGICCDGWEALRARLESILVNMDEWWNDKHLQDVISYLRGKYALMSTESEKQWKKEMHEIIINMDGLRE